MTGQALGAGVHPPLPCMTYPVRQCCKCFLLLAQEIFHLSCTTLFPVDLAIFFAALFPSVLLRGVSKQPHWKCLGASV